MSNVIRLLQQSERNLTLICNMIPTDSEIKNMRAIKTGLGVVNWGTFGGARCWRHLLYSHQKRFHNQKKKITGAVCLTCLPVLVGVLPGIILGCIGGGVNVITDRQELCSDVKKWATRAEIVNVCQQLFNFWYEGKRNEKCIFELANDSDILKVKSDVLVQHQGIRDIICRIVKLVITNRLCERHHLDTLIELYQYSTNVELFETYSHKKTGGQYYESFADRHDWMYCN